MSTVTLWEDGDPLSPSVLNSKLSPLISGVSGVLGVEILSDGSSLGTATAINFVGSSSVSSQAAGQISIAVPTITGTGTQHVRFNSGGTFLEDAYSQDTVGGTSFITYASHASMRLGRRNGSAQTPTDMLANQYMATIDVTGMQDGVDRVGASYQILNESLGFGDLGAAHVFSVRSSRDSVVIIRANSMAPPGARNRSIDCGIDGAVWNTVNAVEFRAATQNSITAQILTATLGGSFPNGGDFWTVYNSLHAGAQSLRLGPLGQSDAGFVYLMNPGPTEAYFSTLTREVMRIGSSTTRFHSINAQGASFRALHTISSYSATTADCMVSVDSSSNLTVTLPNPSTVSGHLYRIKRAGSGTLEVNASSGGSIDNFSVYTLASQWSSVDLVSVGTRYLVV